jgi:hypothetical protein
MNILIVNETQTRGISLELLMKKLEYEVFCIVTREITALIWLYNMMDIIGNLRRASELKYK